MPRLRRLSLALARAALATSLLVTASAARGATPIVYVALGDSTAVGVGAKDGRGYPSRLSHRLEVEGFSVKLVNLGVSGATAADLRREQLPRAMGAGASLVTIAIGLNDLVKGRTLSEFSRDLQVIADTIHKTKAAVVISTLPDLSLAPSAQGSPTSVSRRVQQFNAAIETVAERYGFTVADLWTASRAAERTDGAAVWAEDGFHPSALGYERWADAMAPAAERALAPKLQARRPAVSPGPTSR